MARERDNIFTRIAPGFPCQREAELLSFPQRIGIGIPLNRRGADPVSSLEAIDVNECAPVRVCFSINFFRILYTDRQRGAFYR